MVSLNVASTFTLAPEMPTGTAAPSAKTRLRGSSENSFSGAPESRA